MKFIPLFSKLFTLLIVLALSPQVQSQHIVNPETFRSDISFLASDAMHGRLTGTVYQDIAAEYIKARFMEIGLKPVPGQNDFLQSFYIRQAANPHAAGTADGADSIKVVNVCGYLDNNAARTIVIGAHYDHLGEGGNSFSLSTEKAVHNGADDNSSGVSIMLELATMLKREKNNFNYLFLAFSGEEFGLWGSNYFVKNSPYPLTKMAAMFNLDMVGRLKDEKSIVIGGVGTSPVWKKELEQANISKLNLVFEESGVGPSDHTSFYYANIPVLFFFTGQHGDYHKPTDDIEKINFTGMAQITTNLYALITGLNKVKEIPFTKTKEPEQTRTDFKVTLGIMPDYTYADGGLRVDGVKEGRPGAGAGLKQGDIIYELGSVKITDIQDYMKALNSITPGQKVKIRYKRAGSMVQTDVQF